MKNGYDPTLPDLHLEISSKCTLACPACPRTYRKGEYAVTELPLEVVEKIVRSGQRYKMVTLCGDHGDPIYHTNFHQVMEALLKLPGQPFISIATNGSYRSADWWKKTAALMRPRDEVIFGVDGIGKTSSLYRRNNDWESILTGMKTLKQHSVGRVMWQWILFEFNQHEIPQAARLAKDLKIDNFMIIASSRHTEVDPWRPTITIEEAQRRFQEAYDLPAL